MCWRAWRNWRGTKGIVGLSLMTGIGLSSSDGRHPVLEQTLIEERFVPNDTLLDNREQQILIITRAEHGGQEHVHSAGGATGANGAGRLVHSGGAGDGRPGGPHFTRVGANDDLARGQSTFMVEMNETANILNNATAQSLIVLDEIGRGTSTFDGLSIAWAVAEYLHNGVGAKTLFATHYHELTELAATMPRVKNYNVAVREWQDQVIFLHKILPGAPTRATASRSPALPACRKKSSPEPRKSSAIWKKPSFPPKAAKAGATEEKGESGKAKGDVKEVPQMYLFGGKPKEKV